MRSILSMLLFVLILGCSSSSSLKQKEDELPSNKEEQVVSEKKADEVIIKQERKLLENEIVMGSDTIKIEDAGKVFGAKAFNDSIYYYKTFVGEKEETDIGSTLLKIRKKTGELISEVKIGEEFILNDGRFLIAINFKNNCIGYVPFNRGESDKIICLDNISLSDGNDFIGYEGKLYIKLVKDDYSFSDVMIIESGTFSKKVLGFTYDGYLTLVNNNGSIELVDNDDNIIKVLN